MIEPVMPRWVDAVVATSHPARLIATFDLKAAVLAQVDAGMTNEQADWWFTTGCACAGLVIDDLQCDPGHAEWATAACVYARMSCGEPLTDTDGLIVEAKLAVAWDAGRSGNPTAEPIGGISDDPEAGMLRSDDP